MKKILLVLIMIVLVIAVLQLTALGVDAKARCNGRNWRNPHCTSPTVTATHVIVRIPPATGTVIYVCQSLHCETPGKP